MQHADRSTASLVELFGNMQTEEEPHENGDLDYEVDVISFSSWWNLPFHLSSCIFDIRNRKTSLYETLISDTFTYEDS